MRIFLDANILFSAAKSDGAVGRFITSLLEEGHGLVADPFVVEEARRNLALKFPDAVEALTVLCQRLEMAATPSTGSHLPPDVHLLLPEKDRPVLAAAIRARREALVTGDRTHFGPLYGRTIQGVAIYSPQALAERLGHTS